MGGYFYSSTAFRAWAWTELCWCKLRLIPSQSCSKGHARSCCTPVSWRVGWREGCSNSVCSLSENKSPALRPGCCSSRSRRCGVHQAAILPKCRAKALQVTTSYRHAHLTCFLLCLFSLISSACNGEGDQRKAELCLLSLHFCVFSFLFSLYFWQLEGKQDTERAPWHQHQPPPSPARSTARRFVHYRPKQLATEKWWRR